VCSQTLKYSTILALCTRSCRAGSPYPRMNAHLWFLRLKWHMHKQVQATPDIPHPAIWLVPQWQPKKYCVIGSSNWGVE